MPKSRGRRPKHRSPKPRTVTGKPMGPDFKLVTDMAEFEPFRDGKKKDYKNARSAMVAAALMFGHRFEIGSNDFKGPSSESWTNAWYTAKENKDKGWRYCEGVVKGYYSDGSEGLWTSAWVVDSYGHVLECTPGNEAVDWYQGWVMDEDNDMMNPNDTPWDDGYPRPVVSNSEEGILDGDRQVEALSRMTGEGWLGSMFETAIDAMRKAYGTSYVRAIVTVMPHIIDQQATDRFPKGPNLRDDGAAFEEVADLGPSPDDRNR